MTGRSFSGAMRKCVGCETFFYSPPSSVKKFCSRKCYGSYRRALRVDLERGIARCARCGDWKPLGQFVWAGDGPHSYCKVCSSEWFHERRGTAHESRRPYAPLQKLDPEEKRLRKLVRSKAYREKNKDKVLMWNRLRRHKERAAGPMPHRFELGLLICRQDGKCVYCSDLLTKFHVDHRTPVSRGGGNDILNLQLLCPACNMRKGAKTHEEFVADTIERLVGK